MRLSSTHDSICFDKWLSRLIVGCFVVKSLLNGIYGSILRGCLCGMLGGRWEVGSWCRRCSISSGCLAVSRFVWPLHVQEYLTGTAHSTAQLLVGTQKACVRVHVCVVRVCVHGGMHVCVCICACVSACTRVWAHISWGLGFWLLYRSLSCASSLRSWGPGTPLSCFREGVGHGEVQVNRWAEPGSEAVLWGVRSGWRGLCAPGPSPRGLPRLLHVEEAGDRLDPSLGPPLLHLLTS